MIDCLHSSQRAVHGTRRLANLKVRERHSPLHASRGSGRTEAPFGRRGTLATRNHHVRSRLPRRCANRLRSLPPRSQARYREGLQARRPFRCVQRLNHSREHPRDASNHPGDTRNAPRVARNPRPEEDISRSVPVLPPLRGPSSAPANGVAKYLNNPRPFPLLSLEQASGSAPWRRRISPRWDFAASP